MAIYFLIEPATYTILDVRNFEPESYIDRAAGDSSGKPFLSPVTVTDPPFNEATEVKTGPVDTYDSVTDTSTRVYTVRAKTQQELDDEQLDDDIHALKSGGKDIALVLVELIEWQLANSAMSPTDFSADVRQAFLDIQAIADRLRQ